MKFYILFEGLTARTTTNTGILVLKFCLRNDGRKLKEDGASGQKRQAP